MASFEVKTGDSNVQELLKNSNHKVKWLRVQLARQSHGSNYETLTP